MQFNPSNESDCLIDTENPILVVQFLEERNNHKLKNNGTYTGRYNVSKIPSTVNVQNNNIIVFKHFFYTQNKNELVTYIKHSKNRNLFLHDATFLDFRYSGSLVDVARHCRPTVTTVKILHKFLTNLTKSSMKLAHKSQSKVSKVSCINCSLLSLTASNPLRVFFKLNTHYTTRVSDNIHPSSGDLKHSSKTFNVKK